MLTDRAVHLEPGQQSAYITLRNRISRASIDLAANEGAAHTYYHTDGSMIFVEASGESKKGMTRLQLRNMVSPEVFWSMGTHPDKGTASSWRRARSDPCFRDRSGRFDGPSIGSQQIRSRSLACFGSTKASPVSNRRRPIFFVHTTLTSSWQVPHGLCTVRECTVSEGSPATSWIRRTAPRR